jgi:hypothetical protein
VHSQQLQLLRAWHGERAPGVRNAVCGGGRVQVGQCVVSRER